MTPKVTIISDGTPENTRLFSPKGEEIKGATMISWTIKTGSKATAVVELEDVAIVGDGLTSAEVLNGTQGND